MTFHKRFERFFDPGLKLGTDGYCGCGTCGGRSFPFVVDALLKCGQWCRRRRSRNRDSNSCSRTILFAVFIAFCFEFPGLPQFVFVQRSGCLREGRWCSSRGSNETIPLEHKVQIRRILAVVRRRTRVAMDRVKALPFERLQQGIHIRHGQHTEQLIGEGAVLRVHPRRRLLWLLCLRK